jgi:hypothetical protein
MVRGKGGILSEKDRRKSLFWLAIKAALWGALSRLVGRLIDRLMS